jgi:hypothetical protein
MECPIPNNGKITSVERKYLIGVIESVLGLDC